LKDPLVGDIIAVNEGNVTDQNLPVSLHANNIDNVTTNVIPANDAHQIESEVSYAPLDNMVTMEDYREFLYSNYPGEQQIFMQREEFLMQVIGVYKKPNFNLMLKPEVTFFNEPGVTLKKIVQNMLLSYYYNVLLIQAPEMNFSGRDVGALSKEYFYTGLTAMITDTYDGLPLFEGQGNHKLPMNDISLLNGGIFYKVGQFIAHSAMHTSVGFIGMFQGIVTYLCSESDELSDTTLFLLEDVCDIEIKELLCMVRFYIYLHGIRKIVILTRRLVFVYR